MKPQSLLGLLLSLSVVGTVTLPVLAEPVASVNPQGSSQSVTIPQSSALTVIFPAEIAMDAGQELDHPLTLMLAQPLADSQGNVIAPTNSPISARLKPAKTGAHIIADSVVIDGRVVPIQASSALIPARKVTLATGNQQAQQNSPVVGRLFGSLWGAANGGDRQAFDQAGMLGAGVGILSGLSSPKKVQVVQIPQGSAYVLTLQAPVVLATTQPINQPQSTVISPQFNFKTTQEYAQGLDKFLQAYQGNEMTKTQALTLIKAANTYATTELFSPLYPPTAQRQQVKQLFSFVYAVDNTQAVR